jgi:hypothetical protein
MEKDKPTEEGCRSLAEFDKKYFPGSSDEKPSGDEDACAIGINIARQSLERIREELKK